MTWRRAPVSSGLHAGSRRCTLAIMEHIPQDLDEMFLSDDFVQDRPTSATQSRDPAVDSPQTTTSNHHGQIVPAVDSSDTVPAGDEQVETSDQPANPWLGSKTKTGKARKRLALACIACRRKKIRCSGERPACTHCSRSMIPCVYKVTQRAPAPRTDYMAMLAKRLKRMEDRVIKMIPKSASRDLGAIGRGVVKPVPFGHTQRLTAKAAKKRSAADAFDVELKKWAKQKHVDHNGMIVSTVSSSATDEKQLLTDGAEHLPPIEVQEHLTEVFFDNIYGQYLLLHKPSFVRKLKAGMVPPVLMLAVCAISARFSNHPAINVEPAFLRGEDWATAAADIALARHDQPNITMVTVLLILGLHEYGTCHGGRSWSFGGQALKMAYALQLHRETEYDPASGSGKEKGELRRFSFVDREIRRRTMWACVLMDRFVSSGGYRPPLANTTYLEIQLPIAEMNFQMEIPGPTETLDGEVLTPVSDEQGQLVDAKANMGVSAYVVKIVMIWGRVIDCMNNGAARHKRKVMWAAESEHSRLKQELEIFVEQLPAKMQWNCQNLQLHVVERVASQFVYFHIMIHQTRLFLNGFAIPLAPGAKPPKDVPPAFLAESARAAVAAAGEISALMPHATENNLTAPFAGYSAFTAGIVHVWCMFCGGPESQVAAKENLRQTYRYLNRMKRYWGTLHYLIETTKERYRCFADAAINGSDYSRAQADMRELEQYGAWFDKYPHGVSKVDWLDPDMQWATEAGADAVMSHESDLKGVEEFFASLAPQVEETAAKRSNKKTASVSAAVPSRPRAAAPGVPEQRQPKASGSRRAASMSSVTRPRRGGAPEPTRPRAPLFPLPTHHSAMSVSQEAPGLYHTHVEMSQPTPVPHQPANHVSLPDQHTPQHHQAYFDGSHASSVDMSAMPSTNQHQQNGQVEMAHASWHEPHPASASMPALPTDSAPPPTHHHSLVDSTAWNAPFNIEDASLLDGFFQPGGWFLPFNIPSETPPADTSGPASAFPHPSQIEAHPAAQPIVIHEGILDKYF
ncbi:hypothetical protein KEM52_005519 [Ascosphaera acerosa]|nr:hypothetical protein KEM52_005519 [Ascosphaera acerosa]